MAEQKDGGSTPDLSFIEKVHVYDESDRAELREYLGAHPEAIEPLVWAVSNWGAENTLINWFGEGFDEFFEGYDRMPPKFWIVPYKLPRAGAVEGSRMILEFQARFPQGVAHMGILP